MSSSTPTARGHFSNFSPDSSDSDDEAASFRFFRPRTQRIYDDDTLYPPATQAEIDEAGGTTPYRWEDREVLLIKYIDDFNAVEKIYKKNPVHLFSTTKPASAVRAIKSEILYEEVKHRADSIGMRVNSKKTQLLCISAAGRADVSTFATSPTDGTMYSSKSLKILGFHFGTRPNADAQVEHMKKKFYQRLWLLCHLVKNGLPEADIMAMYCYAVKPNRDERTKEMKRC